MREAIGIAAGIWVSPPKQSQIYFHTVAKKSCTALDMEEKSEWELVV